MRKKIIKRAKRKARKLAILREDPRYLQVIGRLVHEGLLEVPTVKGHRRKFLLEEALWVGDHIEPRVLELLPAIALKRPGLMLFEELPEDLKKIVNDLKKGKVEQNFRGVESSQYMRWVPFVGRKSGLPKLTKTFRFSVDDQRILEELSEEKNITETEAIRRALRLMKEFG